MGLAEKGNGIGMPWKKKHTELDLRGWNCWFQVFTNLKIHQKIQIRALSKKSSKQHHFPIFRFRANDTIFEKLSVTIHDLLNTNIIVIFSKTDKITFIFDF